MRIISFHGTCIDLNGMLASHTVCTKVSQSSVLIGTTDFAFELIRTPFIYLFFLDFKQDNVLCSLVKYLRGRV